MPFCDIIFIFYRCRFLPVGVFAIGWLDTKVHFGDVLKKISGRLDGPARRAKVRLAAVMQRATLCCRMRPDRAPTGHEMKSELHKDTDDLKRSLMA